jgi:hypothetical protein
MERMPAHPQTPHDGQIPGCTITLPPTVNKGLYQDHEWRNTEISHRIENTPSFSPYNDSNDQKHVKQVDKFVFPFNLIVM